MSRAPKPSEVRSFAAAGYLTPAAVAARYGKRYGFTIQWVYKLATKWSSKDQDGSRAVDVFVVSNEALPTVIDDGRNVWLLEAAVKQAIKQRKDNSR